MAKILSIEPTPNPLAFKLKLDQKVTVGGGKHYNKKDEAWDNGIAQRLFDVHGVDTLFFMDDFITVNKTPGGIWDFIFFQTNEILMAAKEIRPIVTGEAGAKAKTVRACRTNLMPERTRLGAALLRRASVPLRGGPTSSRARSPRAAPGRLRGAGRATRCVPTCLCDAS